ncbi:hypothetical protein M413DRAFT_75795, partial [Hebeloma cylindrosporum]
VATLGLEMWNPDVLGTDPNSMYNILHEQLAIQTFQHLVVAHGYAHMRINLSKIKLSLLQRFYRSYVYSRISAAASSAVIFHIKGKPGQSTKVTKFFRMLDGDRVASNLRLKGKNRKMEHHRVDPETPKDSTLTAMLEAAPIDWFEPEVWNTFTVQERVEYTMGGIKVALPFEEHCDTLAKCTAWKNLPEAEFMERYGNDVLAQYQMPTEAEKAQLLRYAAGEDDEVDPMLMQVDREGLGGAAPGGGEGSGV